jgi:thiamine pyrophosphokinase
MAGIKCRIIDDNCELSVCRNKAYLGGHEGQTVSILPLTGEITVNSTGLMYPLDDLKLKWGCSRGVSNIILSADAEITVSGGYALIIMFSSNP